MSQLSRPYQIALGAIALLGAVWFLALRGHSSSSSEPSSSTAAQPPAHASAPATQPGASTPVVHGTAPGVEGRTRASNKARAAVAEPEPNANTPAHMERALAQGKIAVLLFWDHKGIDDRAVRTQLLLLEAAHHLIAPRANQPAVKRLLSATGLELQKKIAVLEATASEVTAFGSF